MGEDGQTCCDVDSFAFRRGESPHPFDWAQDRLNLPPQGEEAKPPLLVVISGPSGAGKDSVLARMKEQPLPYHYAVTATTRPMREHESNGREYIFVSRKTFQGMIADDELLEWAEVYGEMYGVPRSQVTKAHARGQDAIVKVDVQGAATIRRLAPEAVLVFIAPPSIEELEGRLRSRMTESDESLGTRLGMAGKEMADAAWFDHVVVNETGELDCTVSAVVEIIDRERRDRERTGG